MKRALLVDPINLAHYTLHHTLRSTEAKRQLSHWRTRSARSGCNYAYSQYSGEIDSQDGLDGQLTSSCFCHPMERFRALMDKTNRPESQLSLIHI